MIPQSLEDHILKTVHERSGHLGSGKLVKLVKSMMYINDVDKKIQHLTRNCSVCQITKVTNNPRIHYYGTQCPEEVSAPFKSISLDIMHADDHRELESEFRYVLVICCYFSRYLILLPQRGKSAPETMVRLEEVFGMMGYPQFILTDRGGEYKKMRPT